MTGAEAPKRNILIASATNSSKIYWWPLLLFTWRCVQTKCKVSIKGREGSGWRGLACSLHTYRCATHSLYRLLVTVATVCWSKVKQKVFFSEQTWASFLYVQTETTEISTLIMGLCHVPNVKCDRTCDLNRSKNIELPAKFQGTSRESLSEK